MRVDEKYINIGNERSDAEVYAPFYGADGCLTQNYENCGTVADRLIGVIRGLVYYNIYRFYNGVRNVRTRAQEAYNRKC